MLEDIICKLRTSGRPKLVWCKGQFTHAIFDALFVAISTAIFVAAKLQLRIARVNRLRFQCDLSRFVAASFEHARNLMQFGGDKNCIKNRMCKPAVRLTKKECISVRLVELNTVSMATQCTIKRP